MSSGSLVSSCSSNPHVLSVLHLLLSTLSPLRFFSLSTLHFYLTSLLLISFSFSSPLPLSPLPRYFSSSSLSMTLRYFSPLSITLSRHPAELSSILSPISSSFSFSSIHSTRSISLIPLSLWITPSLPSGFSLSRSLHLPLALSPLYLSPDGQT